MKYIAKIFRHYTSYQLVIPKPLIRERNWKFGEVLVITPGKDETVIIESLATWAQKQKAKKEVK